MAKNTSCEPSYGQNWLSRPQVRLSKVCRNRGGRQRSHKRFKFIGDRAREGLGSEHRHAGTVEGISARINVLNLHGDRVEEGQRSDHRQSANSVWERDDLCMSVGASIVSQWSSGGFS